MGRRPLPLPQAPQRDLRTAEGIAAESIDIYCALRDGLISETSARLRLDALDRLTQLLNLADFEARLSALEQSPRTEPHCVSVQFVSPPTRET